MSRRSSAAAAAEPEPQAPPAGFLPAGRWRWVECDAERYAPEEGSEPFRAELRQNLNFAQIDGIPVSGTATYEEVFAAIAPHVRDWNALGIDATTGEVKKLPPPAEAGPDAFRLIEPELAVWIAWRLKTMHLGGDERPKPLRPSAPTPATKSGSDLG